MDKLRTLSVFSVWMVTFIPDSGLVVQAAQIPSFPSISTMQSRQEPAG
jgi:hypothetical protein